MSRFFAIFEETLMASLSILLFEQIKLTKNMLKFLFSNVLILAKSIKNTILNEKQIKHTVTKIIQILQVMKWLQSASTLKIRYCFSVCTLSNSSASVFVFHIYLTKKKFAASVNENFLNTSLV
jgi:hypothetical protein